MKKFKSIHLMFVAVFATAAMFYLNSCVKDPCKDVVCQNGGTCLSGTCSCATGYEGTNCETAMRDKFINASGYSAVENGSASGASTYTLNITTNSNSVDKVYISNVWSTFQNTVNATISGSTITFARQSPDNDGFYVEGNGTISGNSITVSYTVTDETSTPIVTDNVTGTWTKK
ncbi:MAG: hypothetical protein RL138_1696 [Bacteroidota bacterium]|jgi:hypothetical protein